MNLYNLRSLLTNHFKSFQVCDRQKIRYNTPKAVLYDGYEAVIEYDEVDRLFFGRVINTRDIIAFDGKTVDELQKSFETVIDEYLEDCEREGKEPDKVFSGHFNLRISPELHRKISIQPKKQNLSLNSFVEQALKKTV